MFAGVINATLTALAIVSPLFSSRKAECAITVLLAIVELGTAFLSDRANERNAGDDLPLFLAMQVAGNVVAMIKPAEIVRERGRSPRFGPFYPVNRISAHRKSLR